MGSLGEEEGDDNCSGVNWVDHYDVMWLDVV